MKFTIDQDKFSNAMAGIARIANDKSPNPILANVLITVIDSKMELSATNFSVDLRILIPIDTDDSGVITTNANRLAAWAKAVNDDKIKISIGKDGKLYLSAKGSRSSMATMDPEMFPSINFADREKITTLDAKVLRNAINQVSPCVAADENRALNSVSFKFGGGAIELVGGDGQRMAKTIIYCPTEGNGQFLLGSRNLIELNGTILGSAEKVEIHKSGNKILFVSKDITLASLVTNAEYVDYTQLFDRIESKSSVIVDKAQLSSALKRSSLFLEEKFPFLEIVVSSDKMIVKTIEGSSNEYGTSEETIDCELKGDEFRSQFSIKYFQDAVGCILTDRIRFQDSQMVTEYEGKTYTTPTGVLKEVFLESEEDTRHYIHMMAPRA